MPVLLPNLHPYGVNPVPDRIFQQIITLEPDASLPLDGTGSIKVKAFARFLVDLVGRGKEIHFDCLFQGKLHSLEATRLVYESTDQGPAIPVAETPGVRDESGIRISLEGGSDGLTLSNQNFHDQDRFLFASLRPEGRVMVTAKGWVASDSAMQAVARLLSHHLSSSAGRQGYKRDDSLLSIFNPVPSLHHRFDPGIKLLHQVVLRSAARVPETNALEFVSGRPGGGQRLTCLTYRQLVVSAKRLSLSMRRAIRHPRAGELVIVPMLMGPSVELYVSYLAILMAGCAFCPLPIDAPSQRLASLLEDIDASIILCRDGERVSVPRDSIEKINVSDFVHSDRGRDGKEEEEVVVVEEDGDVNDDKGDDDEIFFSDLERDPNDCAYVLFTSGTTGKPKGVMISHEAALCSISSHVDRLPKFALGAGDNMRWFQFAAPTFDPSVMEIFVTLSTGGTLCSAERDLTLSDIEGVVMRSRADIMMSTPSMATLLRPDRLPNLRWLWTMGECLNERVISHFSQTSYANEEHGESGSGLANAYGPTEAAINCTLLEPFPRDFRGSVIGQPLPTCSLAIIDPEWGDGGGSSRFGDLSFQPLGVAGELVIGGPQVGMGYLGRAEQTAKNFVTSQRLGRIYRTGDKARVVWSQDGVRHIEILGRLNGDQIKISGKRVELGEIDQTLSSGESVRDCVTVLYEPLGAAQGNSQLAACVCIDDEANVHDRGQIEQKLRARADAELQPHMRPSRYVFLDSIPTSVSGKTDRKAALELVRPILEVRESAQLTEEDRRHLSSPIAKLVVDSLGSVIDTDGMTLAPRTKLFRLGIDSLRAMRLVQQLQSNGISGLSVATVLKCAEFGHLIREIENLEPSNQAMKEVERRTLRWKEAVSQFDRRWRKTLCDSLPDTVRCKVSKILPTTATQSGMLASFLKNDDRGSDSTASLRKPYINQSVYPLRSDFDPSTVARAFTKAMIRHDAYRTVFFPVNDKLAPFAQCVLEFEDECDAERMLDLHVSHVRVGEGYPKEDDAVQRALSVTEEEIQLSQPPWHICVVQGEKRSFIVLALMHAIFDGASLELLLEEIRSNLICDGEHVLPRKSSSLAVERHFTSDLEASRSYWREKLANAEGEPFPCITGRRKEAVAGRTLVTEVKSRLSMRELSHKARSCESTPLSLLHLAWSILLSAYYEDHVSTTTIFGSVQSGRLDQDAESCMGPTFNTVPFCFDFGGGKERETVGELIRRATRETLSSLEHLEIPLGALAGVDGKLPFDTLFAFQNFNEIAHSEDESWPWNKVEWPAMGNDFPAMVEIWPTGSGSPIRIKITFKDHVLDSGSATMLLHQFDEILNAILDHSDDDLFSIWSSVSPQVLSSCNTESAAQGRSPCSGPVQMLHSAFERNAAEHPDDLALVFQHSLGTEAKGTTELSYSELNRQSNQLANHLISVNRGQPLTDTAIPVCLERSPELYVSVLGILKSGAGWCPIDPEFPVLRQRELILRTGSKVLVTSQGILPRLELPEGVEPILVDSKLVKRQPFEVGVGNGCGPETLAYLIWTSGTTGSPKGVMIDHRAAHTSMASLIREIPPPGKSKGHRLRTLQFSAFTFDVFVQDLFWTWGLGGTVVASTREIMLGSTVKLIEAAKVNHAHLTPAFAAGIPGKSCQGLESVTFIGEKLGQAVADDWGAVVKDAYNTYGPAEATVVSTYRKLASGESVQSGNVGLPLASVKVYVISNGRLCLRGGVGELALGGPQVARGYLDDEERTRKSFVWSKHANERLYMTGDIVRMLHDQTLEFIGRRDDLVKLGGIRVELGEISASLRDPSIKVEHVETMFISRPDRPVKQVVSFLICPSVGHAGGTQLLVESRQALKVAEAAHKLATARLPTYMVPSVFLVLARLPQTASAKVDRVAIQRTYEAANIDFWDQAGYMCDSADAAVEGISVETLEAVVSAIASLVEVDKASLRGSSKLSSLGLDSIRAVRLAAKLAEVGLRVSVKDALQSKTLADLVRRISEGESAVEAALHQELRKRLAAFNQDCRARLGFGLDDQGSHFVPCSNLQEGMIAEALADPRAYWGHHIYELPSNVDFSLLFESWKQVAATTETLRTCFVLASDIICKGEGSPLSFDSGRPSFVIQRVEQRTEPDLKILPALTKDDEVEDILTSEASALIETEKHLEKSLLSRPPWFVRLVASPSRRTMLFSIHHSLYDGPTILHILDDVARHYASCPAIPSRLGSKEMSLRSHLFSRQEQEDSLAYWKEHLKVVASLSTSSLPDLTAVRKSETDKQRVVSFMRSKRHLDLVPLGGSSAVRSVASTSLFKLAFGVVLAQYSEAEACLLGETLSTRGQHPSLYGAVGPLLSTVPVLIKMDQDNLRANLTELERNTRDSNRHRFLPMPELRAILGRPTGSDLFDAMFVYHPQNGSVEDAISDSLGWRRLEKCSTPLQVEHGVVMNVFEKEAGVEVEIASKEDRINQRQIDLLLDQTCGLIEAFLIHQDRSIRSCLRSLEERLKSSDGSVARGERVAVPAMTDPEYWLEMHASLHPHWPAATIVSSEFSDLNAPYTVEQWDYKALNEEANRFAAFIVSRDMQEGPVAFCLGRTLQAYAAMLGIFKSGRTYVPIDEGLPDGRKRLLLADSRAKLVFVQGADAAMLSREGQVAVGDCMIVDCDDTDFKSELESYSGMNSVRCLKRVSFKEEGAYLLYTSGSTGKPKGVHVSRGNLCSFVESYAQRVLEECPKTAELRGKGRYLGLASRAFDVHLSQAFMAWRFGFAAASGEKGLLLSDLGLTVRTLGITHLSCVPSLLDQSDMLPDQVPTLCFLGVGGEKLTERVRETFAGRSEVVVMNAYGPTETTIMCSLKRVRPMSTTRDIGHVLGGNRASVRDQQTGHLVLRGRPGELCISGGLVAIGYLDRPDQGGFVEIDGERTFLTGDIVRMMADGSLEFLGRRDDQTKIRGQRLELGEISESARREIGDEWKTLALIHKHPQLPKELLMLLVTRRETSISDGTVDPRLSIQEVGEEADIRSLIGRIKKHCKANLPAYMVPDFVLPVTHLPILAGSGKVNLKQIRSWISTLSADELVASDYQGLRPEPSPLEQGGGELDAEAGKVLEIMGRILQVDSSKVSPSTSIFELGFDSMSIILLCARLRAEGFKVGVSEIQRQSTIEEIAASKERDGDAWEMKGEESRRDPDKVVRDFQARHIGEIGSQADGRKVEFLLPCSPMQEGMVALSQANPSEPMYVAEMMIEFDEGQEGKARVNDFVQAWMEASSSHHILRTCFDHVDDSTIAQVVLSEVKREDLCIAVASDEEEIRREISKRIVRELRFLPPWRLLLLSRGEGGKERQARAWILIHHSLYDGISLGMLLDEVNTRVKGSQAPTRLPFSSFISHIYSMDGVESSKFWKETLKGAPLTRFQVTEQDEGDCGARSTASYTCSWTLSDLERGASSQLKVTLASLCRIAFGVELARLQGCNDVTFGTVLSGRSLDLVGAQSVMGPCLTTLPHRLTASDPKCKLSLWVERDHLWSSEALKYQHTPLREIRRHAEKEENLFESIFSYVVAAALPTSPPPLWSVSQAQALTDQTLAIEFFADKREDILSIRMDARSGIANLSDPSGFLESIERTISKFIEEPGARVGSLGLTVTQHLAVEGEEDEEAEEDSEDWTEVEKEMRQVACQMCGVDPALLGKRTPFLRIGLDSIVALRFSGRLRALGIEIYAHEVLRSGCLGNLAKVAKVPQTKLRESVSRVDEALGAKKGNDYPCTPLQSGMLTQTLASDGSLYVHHHPFMVKPGTDIEKLTLAWKRVVTARDILRSSFSLTPAGNWSATVHDQGCSLTLNEEESESDALQILQRLQKEFRYGDEEAFSRPPISAKVFPCKQGNLLVVSMHHSLYDGISVPFIFGDLAKAYHGAQLASRNHFSVAAMRIDEKSGDSVKFWTQSLDDFEPGRLGSSSTDRETSSSSMRWTGSVDWLLGRSRELGVSIQSAAMLATFKLLASLTGQRDVCLGHVSSGRYLDVEGAEDIVGPLMNTLPVRFKLGRGSESNLEALKRLQDFSFRAQEFQHAPLSDIQSSWRRRRGHRGRLFDCIFVFNRLDGTGESEGGGGPLLRPVTFAGHGSALSSEYPLNIAVTQREDSIVVGAAASSDLGDGQFLERATSKWIEIFEDLMQRPGRSSTALPAGLASLPITHSSSTGALEGQNVSEVVTRPLTEVEREVVIESVSRRLRVPVGTVKSASNLFVLGLDSLSSIRIASDCRSQGLRLGPADILAGGGLSIDRIRVFSGEESGTAKKGGRSDAGWVRTVEREEILSKLGLKEEEVEEILPCLAGQAHHIRSWLSQGLRFFEPTWIYCSDDTKLDVERLAEAWKSLVEEVEILRTCFVACSTRRETLFQVILRSRDRDSHSMLRVVQGGKEEEKEARILSEVRELNRTPSDLFRPPIRICLLRFQESDVLLLTIHHSCYDAWSMRKLIDELSKRYQTRESNGTMPKFSSFVEHTLSESGREEERTFWTRWMRGAEQTLICRRITGSNQEGRRGGEGGQGGQGPRPQHCQTLVRVSVLGESLSSLEGRCRDKLGLGIQPVIVHSFSKMLGRLAQVESPTFGLYTSGRSSSFEGVERLVGPTLNLQPMTVKVRGGRESSEALAEEIRMVNRQLGERARFEQSSIQEILAWSGGGSGGEGSLSAASERGQERLFDSHLNLIRSREKGADGEVGGGEKQEEEEQLRRPLFRHLGLREGTRTTSGYFTDMEPLTGVETSCGMSGDGNVGWEEGGQLFMDVGLNAERDAISVGIRCDSFVMDDEAATSFCVELAKTMAETLDAL
ncbi:acetyl-CoA synthetase-like protein [Violaceomyces palustris]|uniref:Acetyl-CoA synthetase-like protein n=1 Tax=Violaceomyces palustris TaxID=1673888 RepID=A0ACD0P0C9_9BASI|nr:acetyl-CoA synthetase-like protein [Violaceomyces palustris]